MNFAVLEEMGQKDTRLDEVEEGIRILNWSFRQLIIELKAKYPQYENIATSTFFRWRNGETTGRQKPWVDDILVLIRESLTKLSTPLILRENSRNLYGIKDGKDSASGPLSYDLSKLLETINVSLRVIKVGAPWSAKGIDKVNVKLSAMLSAGVEHILINGDLNQIKSGSVITFAATTYPQDGIYLLWREKEGDQCLIGWIPFDHPTSIHTSSGTVYPVADWSPVGYAVCVSWGPGEVKSQMRADTAGIGPHTRI